MGAVAIMGRRMTVPGDISPGMAEGGTSEAGSADGCWVEDSSGPEGLAFLEVGLRTACLGRVEAGAEMVDDAQVA